MEARDRFNASIDSVSKTQLVTLRKKDIAGMMDQTTSPDALRWLDKIRSAKVGQDHIFDYAWQVVNFDKTEAIVWISPDQFNKYHINIRVVTLKTVEHDIIFWLDLIRAVHTHEADALSISWLLMPDQSTAQEALRRWNYSFLTRLRGLMSAPDSLCPQDAWLFRTDCLQRPDQGVAFVAFKFGWLAVHGCDKGIRFIDFIRTGSHIDNVITAFYAYFLNIIDNNGLVLAAADSDYEELKKQKRYLLPDPVANAAAQIKEYLEGKLSEFDVVINLDHHSGFQQNVWAEITKVPYGATATYEDLAKKIANPGQKAHSLARAVGTACASNPLPVVIPCHRIIGKDGRLTGFNGGVDIKEYLLNHEMLGVN